MKHSYSVKVSLSVFLILVIGWNYQLIRSVSKPYLIKTNLIKTSAQEMPDDSISYPKLGINAPINVSNTYNPFYIRDWDSIRELLEKGVGIFYEGKDLDSSNFVYAVGHSTSDRPQAFSSVFASLNLAQINDEIQIKTNGGEYKYKVVKKTILSPYDTKGFSELFSNDGSLRKQKIALVTCWPLFTTKERLVVLGERDF